MNTQTTEKRVRCSRHAAEGFTLVELIVVISIVAILSAMAAPRFFNNDVFAERGYADELASALRNAQKVAVASGCWSSLTVAPAGYSAMQRSPGSDCASLGAWTTPIIRADGTPLAGATPSDASVAATSQFIFDGAGHLQSGATNVQVGPYTVSVEPRTGFVSVQ